MKTTMDLPEIKVNEHFVRELSLPKIMGQELMTTRTRLLTNLNQGLDAEGAALRPYSPAYAKQKSEVGVGGYKGTGSTTPNLLVSQELHKSMNVKVPASLNEEATIEFHGTHKGGFSNAGLAATLYQRGFVGWFRYGKVDFDRTCQSISRQIDKFLKRLVDGK